MPRVECNPLIRDHFSFAFTQCRISFINFFLDSVAMAHASATSITESEATFKQRALQSGLHEEWIEAFVQNNLGTLAHIRLCCHSPGHNTSGFPNQQSFEPSQARCCADSFRFSSSEEVDL